MRVIKYNGFESVDNGLAVESQFDEVEARKVRRILEDVRVRGDEAVREYTMRFDGVHSEGFCVDPGLLDNFDGVDGETLRALRLAASRLGEFARRQLGQLDDFEVETAPGVFAGQRVVPIQRVGVYVPGGNFPLVSSLLMGAVPAAVAGVSEIVVCTPPGADGLPPSPILAAAAVAGVTEVYAIGGVQAIAALAYGTETVKPVDKIVGPGNRYVTAAKKEVYGRVGIDFIAGPSEVMVVADASADAQWIAADLLAQAEHDVSAVPILVTDSENLMEKVRQAVNQQLAQLGTRDIAVRSIEDNGVIFQVETMDQAIEVANRVAPEHLELHLAVKCGHAVDRVTEHASGSLECDCAHDRIG